MTRRLRLSTTLFIRDVEHRVAGTLGEDLQDVQIVPLDGPLFDLTDDEIARAEAALMEEAEG